MQNKLNFLFCCFWYPYFWEGRGVKTVGTKSQCFPKSKLTTPLSKKWKMYKLTFYYFLDNQKYPGIYILLIQWTLFTHSCERKRSHQTP